MARTSEERRAYQKAWYEANREAIIARSSARARENPEETKAYKKRYAEANRERISAQRKAFRQANRERLSAEAKAKYLANSEAFKTRAKKSYLAMSPEDRRAKWHERAKRNCVAYSIVKRAWEAADRAANPERYREKTMRHEALKRATTVEPIDYRSVLKDSGGVCGICHKPLDLFGIDFDHIVPLARGGTHTRSNIQATHSRCNRAKGARVA